MFCCDAKFTQVVQNLMCFSLPFYKWYLNEVKCKHQTHKSYWASERENEIGIFSYPHQWSVSVKKKIWFIIHIWNVRLIFVAINCELFQTIFKFQQIPTIFYFTFNLVRWEQQHGANLMMANICAAPNNIGQIEKYYWNKVDLLKCPLALFIYAAD